MTSRLCSDLGVKQYEIPQHFFFALMLICFRPQRIALDQRVKSEQGERRPSHPTAITCNFLAHSHPELAFYLQIVNFTFTLTRFFDDSAVDERVEREQGERRPGPRCLPGAANQAGSGQRAPTRVPPEVRIRKQGNK